MDCSYVNITRRLVCNTVWIPGSLWFVRFAWSLAAVFFGTVMEGATVDRIRHAVLKLGRPVRLRY